MLILLSAFLATLYSILWFKYENSKLGHNLISVSYADFDGEWMNHKGAKWKKLEREIIDVKNEKSQHKFLSLNNFKRGVRFWNKKKK